MFELDFKIFHYIIFSHQFDINVINVTEVINRSKRQRCVSKSKSETLLLAWLEYNHVIIFHNRTINNFEECLNDGLAFIAVTLNYCPFLKDEFFNDIFSNPVDKEMKIHNAICLIQAWKAIRLGFIVTPLEIVNPNCVQMLMLTVHLFQHLPTYLIKNKLVFSCPLTKTVGQQIKLSIPTDQQINFVVQFFGNEMNFFSSKAIISLKPQSQQIKITYHARKLQKTKAYLVLCGSSIGTNFVDNQTFVLEGFPDELEISGEYSIRSKLYQIVEKNISINVPYNFTTNYDIWISNERPIEYDKLVITRWRYLEYRRVPRRLLFKENSLYVEEGWETANLPIIVACLISVSRSFWIIFRSEMADFIIQINSNYQSSITDHASIDVMKEECICTELPAQVYSECPLNKKLSISSRNNQLQNCLIQIFRRSLLMEESVFWSTYLHNYVGIRVIKWLTRDTEDPISKDFKHVFNTNVTYNVAIDKKSLLVLPHFIKTEGDNQKYDINIELSIHMPEVNSDLTNALVTLTSTDKKEIRLCKIDFIYEESTTTELKNNKTQVTKNNKTQVIKNRPRCFCKLDY